MSSPTPIVPNFDALSLHEGMPAPSQSGTRASLGTLTGIAHPINQDMITHQPGLFSGVADGVGGGANGEVASRLLIQQISSRLPKSEISAKDELASIDRHIAHALYELGDGPGASVFAAAWPLDDRHDWQTLWVGDCQVTHYQYLGTHWQISWQSQAQTYLTHHLTPPVGVAPDSPANMVGSGLSLAPGWHRFTANSGDRIVIASDGFHKAFSASETLDLLAQAKAPLALQTAQEWCYMARQRGSQDDISVVILEIAPSPISYRLVLGTSILLSAMIVTIALLFI